MSLDMNVSRFRLTSRHLDPVTGDVTLSYAFDERHDFTERIGLGAPEAPPSPERVAALERGLEALHIAAGVSYYKAFCPPVIALEAGAIDRDRAEFFSQLYINGLGEFAFRNGLDLRERVRFAADAPPAPPASSVGLPRRTLLPIGGGKDSLVSLETLRRAGEPLVLFALNRARPIMDCIERSGLPSIVVSRKLDPALFDLNAAGALNGHVPITAILSLIASLAAILHGADAVVLSNERSANEGNVTVDGFDVNHQYSKSLQFESALAGYLRQHVAQDLRYFSLLRPLSELHIAQLFARHDRYDDVFTSCNKNFRQSPGVVQGRWCLDCPKCRFTALALATAMPRARLVGFMGGDILDDPAQLEGYRQLVGLTGLKPWECVGELAESSAALWSLSGREEWREAAIVAAITPEIARRDDDLDATLSEQLTPSATHRLPPEFSEALDDVLARR